MIEDILAREAQAYAALRRLCIAEPLGFGIHGIVMVADDKARGTNRALKVHRAPEFYLREQFEGRWPQVQAIRRSLEGMGIYLLDVSPSNVGFLD